MGSDMLEDSSGASTPMQVGRGSLVAQDIRQAGAICYRRAKKNGRIEVLLIGSLRNGRWGIPKGHVHSEETTGDAALREAFEEAGVRGFIEAEVFGTFSYAKEGNSSRFHVSVHLLCVTELAANYPEKNIRKAKWVSAAAAARAASRPGLRTIFERFDVVVA
jgi:8-oxo-dGTP pyrophosphatase MutT (NUDIX family)